MKSLKCWVIVMTVFSSSAEGSFGMATMMAGSELLDTCTTSPDSPEHYSSVSFCRGYISGISDASQCGHKMMGFNADVPVGVMSSQLQKVVVKWLNDNPQKLHLGASGLVAQALQEAFPCQ